jgi:hypothetical protein
MGKQQYTNAIHAVITSSSGDRVVESQYSGLKVNSLLLDVVLTPASSKSWNLDVLKEMYLNVNFRRKDADALQLVDNCRLWDLFVFSDYNAGVSVDLVDEVKPKTAPVEVSAVVPFGSFAVGIDESLEVMLTGKPASVADYSSILLDGRWAYFADVTARTFGYKSFASVGGEQSYRDALNLFYIGPSLETNATVRDYTGSQTVNLKDAVAFANASGRFEYFSDFGIVYMDPTGYSQDLTISLEGAKRLLLQQEYFSLSKLLEQDGQMLRDKEAVLQAIYAVRPEKYEVLRERGVVPSSFVPAR